MALRHLFAFVLVLLGTAVLAQDTLMVVYGTVRDFAGREPIANSHAVAFDFNDTGHRMVETTSDSGRYHFDLTEERTYRILFTAEGYYPKLVQIDLQGPSPQEWVGGYGMSVDIMLLPIVDGMDLWGDGEPIGKARFVKESGKFEWDLEHTKAYKAKFAEAMEAYKAHLGVKDR